MMTSQRSSQDSGISNASVPEVLSLPALSLVHSMDKLNENKEQELQSVSSYNSLSSLSSCGSGRSNSENDSVCSQGSVNSRPRSIFKKYWENSGSTSFISRADKTARSVTTPATASVSSWDTDDESAAANSYERILKRNEGVKTRRRTIFGGSQYQSSPSLARPYHPAPLERKAKSACELEKRRLPSCLRTSHAIRARSSSVSFDCEVSVITYSKPKENWAAEGWSKLFDASIE